MDRRTFFAASSASLALSNLSYADSHGKVRIGVIGHTGRGNFGHGLDTVWQKVPESEIVAVADPHEKGRAAAQKRLGLDSGFADYGKMLNAVRPDIVAVCTRYPDQHLPMILAAIEAGARGIYVEKPFCRTPAEADEITKACNDKNVKLAIAHRNRYHPLLQVIDRMIQAGDIGNILEIRGRGKGDRRGGGEDLWVLGSHIMNLIHYFGGDPKTCSSLIRTDGRPVTKEDVKEGNEALGPLAGNEVHARYEMARGMIAYFDSIANDGTQRAGFGLRIIGSEGVIHMHCDRDPFAHLVLGNPFRATPEPQRWVAISSAGPGEQEPHQEVIQAVIDQVIPARDLIQAVLQDRAPLCGLKDATMTVEMICSVFASHREGGQAVSIPLIGRGNALSRL